MTIRDKLKALLGNFGQLWNFWGSARRVFIYAVLRAFGGLNKMVEATGVEPVFGL